MSRAPLGIAELCDRGTAVLLACPVRGCDGLNPCPTHHLKVHKTRGGFTYVYEDFYDNLLWRDSEDRRRLDAILEVKRESRMENEHSEDAVTWNVFRFFERRNLLSSALGNLFPCPHGEPLAIFWTARDRCVWDPYRSCCKKHFSEPVLSELDVIFMWPQEMLVIVEAKFRSSNRSDPSVRSEELRKSERYIQGASQYLNRDKAYDSVRDGYYQLLRNWAIGTRLKEDLGCKTFVLANLLRKRHEHIHHEDPLKQFAQPACKLSSECNFVVGYWEDLIGAAGTCHSDSTLLISWARNKSELLGKPAFDFH